VVCRDERFSYANSPTRVGRLREPCAENALTRDRVASSALMPPLLEATTILEAGAVLPAEHPAAPGVLSYILE